MFVNSVHYMEAIVLSLTGKMQIFDNHSSEFPLVCFLLLDLVILCQSHICKKHIFHVHICVF